MADSDSPLANQRTSLELRASQLRNGAPNTTTQNGCGASSQVLQPDTAHPATDVQGRDESFLLVLVDAHSHPVSSCYERLYPLLTDYSSLQRSCMSTIAALMVHTSTYSVVSDSAYRSLSSNISAKQWRSTAIICLVWWFVSTLIW
jgi:hypothetical protein